MPCQSLPCANVVDHIADGNVAHEGAAREDSSQLLDRSELVDQTTFERRQGTEAATAMRGRQDHVPRGVDDAWPGLLLRVSPPGGTRAARAWPRRPPLAAVDANGGSAHLAVLVLARIVANAHLSRLRRGGRVGGLAWADRPWAARRGDLQQGACQFSRSMVWPAVGARYPVQADL